MIVLILRINFASNLGIIIKMTNEIIEKITLPRTHLDIAEISIEEKKNLLAFFSKKGFSTSTFYLRFFQKGFSEWEILGIKECKNQFLELSHVAKVLLDFVDTGDIHGDKGYYYTLAHSDAPGVFYSCLKRANGGLCNKFIAFMGELGMSSGTVIKRFANDDWKPWEINGIRTILTNYNNNKNN